MAKKITFFHSKICMKCIRVRRILGELEQERPDLEIERIGSLDRLITRKIRTIPAIKINDSFLFGSEITKEKILAELED